MTRVIFQRTIAQGNIANTQMALVDAPSVNVLAGYLECIAGTDPTATVDVTMNLGVQLRT